MDDLKNEREKEADTNKREQLFLRDSLMIEKDSALLELKIDFQKQLEEQQAKHTAAISGYENKVKELLGLMEQEKPVQLPAKAKGGRPKGKAVGADAEA